MVKLIKGSQRKVKKVGGGVSCSRPGACIRDDIAADVEEEDPNTIDEYLALAIEEEMPGRVQRYLREGANPNITITDEQTGPAQGAAEQVPAIIYAARHIHPPTILRYLLEGSIIWEGMGTTPLIEAAEWGNLHTVGYLLDRGADINGTNRDGFTAIGHAVLGENIPMIRLMLDKRKGKIDFNFTAFGTDNRNVIDDAEENTLADPEIAKILKKYAIEQQLPIHSGRQHNKVNLGRVLQGVRGTSNRGPTGELPRDVLHHANSFLGGKRKTKHRRKPRKKNSRKKNSRKKKHTRKRR